MSGLLLTARNYLAEHQPARCRGTKISKKPLVVIAGGSGALGLKIAANFAEMGHEVVILTRTVREAVPFQQVVWDGRTVENAWGRLVSGSLLINLSGELVDKRPTAKNIALLKSSRVLPSRALVEASKQYGSPSLWLQMSTLAIYGAAAQGAENAVVATDTRVAYSLWR
jgi:NAD dependent epimerase/dehydratase family enzyme